MTKNFKGSKKTNKKKRTLQRNSHWAIIRFLSRNCRPGKSRMTFLKYWMIKNVSQKYSFQQSCTSEEWRLPRVMCTIVNTIWKMAFWVGISGEGKEKPRGYFRDDFLPEVWASLIQGSMTSSVQFSHSVMSDSLQHHELQHARPPCPLPTPRVHSDSRPSSQWCHPAISSSVVPFSSCPQSLPAS